jgi:ABC-2 type transport system ATP-binding protein
MSGFVNVIQTYELTKYYGKVRGVEGLSLEVKPGEIFGFLGPNGSGKTTTIRLLLDLIRPTRGHAEIFGLDVRTHSLGIRQRLGNLPGDVSLYQNLSGEEFWPSSADYIITTTASARKNWPCGWV